jgi:CDP-diacylglycerol---serine O-phosphatidyltransferase
MKNLRFLIPNLFTTLSLFSAMYAIVLISNGEYILPAWLIMFSMLCDFLDGKSARLLNAISQFGKMYDTMSDLIAFGITPAFLVYKVALEKLSLLGALVAAFYVFSGCFRLIRFTLRHKVEQHSPKNGTRSLTKDSFWGLPIPMAASVLATGVLSSLRIWNRIPSEHLLAIIILMISLLMISRIEYLSFDEESKTRIGVKLLVILVFLSIIFTFHYIYITFFIWTALYIIYGLIRYIVKPAAKRPEKANN